MAKRKKKVTVNDLVSTWEPRLRDAFLAAVQNLRDGVEYQKLVTAIQSGDIEAALRAVRIEPAAYGVYVEELRNAYNNGGITTVDNMPPLQNPQGERVVMRFDVRDLDAEEWISEHSSKHISEITEDLKQSVRDVLTKGLADGDNPKTTATRIAGKYNRETGERDGGILGLTRRQRQSIDNASVELDENPAAYLERKLRNKRFDKYAREAMDGKPIPADVKRKMLAALESRTAAKRAETVARTESMTTLHASQREAYEQAIKNGYARPEEIEREWSATSGSKPTRESHIALDGQKRGFNEPYDSPVTGAKLMYPGDPNAPAEEIINCRCWEVFRINYLKRITG